MNYSEEFVAVAEKLIEEHGKEFLFGAWCSLDTDFASTMMDYLSEKRPDLYGEVTSMDLAGMEWSARLVSL